MIALQLFQPETANQLQCTNITIINDMVLEVDEVFFVVLSSSEPRIIINPNTSIVTILDDDSTLILSLNSLMPLSVSYFTFLVCTLYSNSAVTVGFTMEDDTVIEDAAGVTVCVTLNGTIARNVTVNFSQMAGMAEG